MKYDGSLKLMIFTMLISSYFLSSCVPGNLPPKELPLDSSPTLMEIKTQIATIQSINTPTNTPRPTSTETPTFTPTITFTPTTTAVSFDPPITFFMGDWVNIDPETRGITRIYITASEGILYAHMWGKCHPTDCDNGTRTVTYTGAPVKLFHLTDFAKKYFTLTLNGDFLHVQSYTDFFDEDGRTDFSATYEFSKH